jgi:nitrate reductase NapAB chaperone NapD
VQAIIPGRAWIGDSNGRIITVTQGDRVEALNSTVSNIDPINGVVTLSNGMQIEYGMVAQ